MYSFPGGLKFSNKLTVCIRGEIATLYIDYFLQDTARLNKLYKRLDHFVYLPEILLAVAVVSICDISYT